MRFSKAVLQQYIQAKIDGIQGMYGFDPGNGTFQLEHVARYLGASVAEVTRQYGRFLELINIASEFGLSINAIGNYKCERVAISGGCFHFKYVGEHEKT